jgi:hypothetical protein
MIAATVSESKKQQHPVETVEEFKLRIASIIRGKTQEIPSPRRTNPLLVRPKKRGHARLRSSVKKRQTRR